MVVMNTLAKEDVQQRFLTLAADWKKDIAVQSSTSAIVNHPAYQGIIALGPPVIPFLLKDMEIDPVHWFEALQAITGEDPVPREDWGKMRKMADAWLEWGRKRGVI
jgi:hypothetical protein